MDRTIKFKYCKAARTGSGRHSKRATRSSSYFAICVDDHICAVKGCEIDLDEKEVESVYKTHTIIVPINYAWINYGLYKCKISHDSDMIRDLEQQQYDGPHIYNINLNHQNIIQLF